MGAVNQTVNPQMYDDLQKVRTKASAESDDSRWNLEYNIDKAVARVISAAGIRAQVEQAIQQVIIDWKKNHP